MIDEKEKENKMHKICVYSGLNRNGVITKINQ
jgi:hypothetical protein